MGFSISPETIENIKSRISIVDVAGQVVKLERAGSNFKGLCPFHNEKTPSFMVSETRQSYTCFGCGAFGDVIGFVRQYYNMDFVDAVEKLANDYGIKIEKGKSRENRDEYYEINRMAAHFFYDTFKNGRNPGHSYMRKRGIRTDILKRFGIGYADDSWDSLYKYLQSQGVDDKKMRDLGLISTKSGKCYDRFRNRVMFPIINTGGKVIGFGGRAISDDDEPKYLNSSESGIFRKKNNLYGLNISRQAAGKTRNIILVEGYMDVISLFQSGVENVAASLGTALTENQASLLKRYVDEVILSYDSDAAGRKAALRGIEVLRNENVKVKVLHVTDGKDPDEYVKKNGRKAFLDLIDGALPYAEYKLESAKLEYDIDNDEQRLEYLDKAVKILARLTPIEREIYKKKLSVETGIAESAIERELDRTAGREKKANEPRRTVRKAENETETVSALDRVLIKLALTDEVYIDKILNEPELIRSVFLKRVLTAAKESFGRKRFMEVEDVMGMLEDDEGIILQEILSSTIIDGNHHNVFKECVSKNKLEILSEKEKQLFIRLSMAEEQSDERVIRDITDELMRVQKSKKLIQR